MKNIIFILLALTGTQSLAEKNPIDYFPESYDASKARFLGYAEQIKNKFARVEHESIVVGADHLTGTHITVDTLYIPAQKNPKKLIVLTSGTHGPEGYAGSALQALFVEELLSGMNLDETGVLMVHALNAWGFKNNRRDTENDVNLNRNFELDRSLFSTSNEGYDRLRALLEIERPVTQTCSYPAKDLLMQIILRKASQQALTEAIGKGQYISKNGIDYGGRDFEPQTLGMIQILRQIAPHYSAIFHIDLHTGLGKKNVLHIMTKRELNPLSQAAQAKLFDPNLDKGQYELAPPDSEGFYEIHGDYANIIEKILKDPKKVVIGITAEFGTVGNGLVGKLITINRLILENQGHHYGYKNSHIEKVVKKRYLELFNPSNKTWRTRVMTQGRYLLDVVMKRFIEQNQN